MRRRWRFVERRKTVGLSQEKLAEVIGVDRITVVRWENGDYAPQPGQRPLLAKALAVSVEELHVLLTAVDIAASTATVVKEPTAFRRLPEPALAWAGDVDRSSAVDQLPALLGQLDALAGDDPTGPSPHRREAAYTQLVHYLAAWAHTVNRRELLRVLGWAATAAAGSPALHHLDEQESERVALAIQTPQRVDGQVVDHIEAVLWRCTKQDDLLGPQATLDTVLAQRSLVRSLLPEAPTVVRDRLLSTYGGLSRLAGWLSFNLNHLDAAAGYYESARQAAHEARDTELAAFVLANMAWVATDRGQARVALDHATNAQHWAGQADDLRLRAYAMDNTARALARDGQDAAAFTAMEHAIGLLARADADRASYAYWLTVGGRLDWTETRCNFYLGDHERGAIAAEQDRAAIDPASEPRTYARITLMLAACRLRTAKPDVAGAAQAIGEAATLAAHYRSPQLVEQLRHGVTELEPWRDAPEVRQVRHQLAAQGLT
ncbi:MAG TPA: helix-turn-helix transcriptional regulator [Micromonosporaceae bacterium]|nr:helix-turn-helix transcriptional regulator [Micromonosporaceae bacterium]